MKLTPQQKKIAIFAGIGAITIAYLVWKRNKNNEEAQALLNYIANSKSEVNLSEATQQTIDEIKNIPIDKKVFEMLAVIPFDKPFNTSNALIGKYSPQIRNALSKIVVELYSSIKGVGTDSKAFYKALFRIRNQRTLALVNYLYKQMFKEDLYTAMADESALNSAIFAKFSDAEKNLIVIPFYTDKRWNPNLATYFKTLPY